LKEFFILYIKPILGFALVAFLVWYFFPIFIYILIATLLSLMGMPMVKKLNKVKIRKRMMPRGVSAAIALFVMMLIVGLFITIIVPLVVQQANVISNIDPAALVDHFQQPIDKVNTFLHDNGLIEADQTFAKSLEDQIKSFISFDSFTSFFTNLATATGNIFMGIFIILFLTFYFLMEDNLVKNFILLLTPDEHVDNIERVLHDSKLLLVRYFHGILLEIVIMMTLESAGLLILGVPNAILIGFLGGLMNVIPYLGPIIGASIGIVLASLSELSLGNYDVIGITIFSVILVFSGANLVDNFILQPQIYSRRVKAHPVEVFLVIILGGQLAGIAGMILAIPAYTVFKVIAREFAQRMKLVKFLTRKM
jgi:predicted PurR-regulated permease PerM